MVFASFIRKAADVEAIRRVLGDEGKHILIISKVTPYCSVVQLYNMQSNVCVVQYVYTIVNPRHACARVTVVVLCVCVSVCLSVRLLPL